MTSRSTVCPFCGCHPYEYVDIGVGYEAVAVNCCEFGSLLFDWRTENADNEKAWAVADQLGDMPHGEERFQRATDLLHAAFPEWTA